MEDFLTFTGPVKLLIIERALIKGKNSSRKEGVKEILTRLVINEHRLPSSELKENSTIDYHYNEKQQLTLIQEKEKTGHIKEEIRFSYREHLLHRKEKLNSDGSSGEIHDYKYNTDNHVINEKCGSRQFKFEYDSHERIKSEYRYFGKEPELALLYSYNDEGNVIEIKTVDSKGSQIRLEKFTWDNGLLTEHFCLNRDNVILNDDIFEYSCFHDGNWLKRVRYTLMSREKRAPVEVIYRSITYADIYPELKPIHHNSTEILKEEKKALSFSDGSTYRGDLENGKMDGRGYIQWPDGSSYKGDFKDNQMDGRGILTWSNGDIYSGTFTAGKMEGIGRLRWKQGKTFYGLFEDDRRTNQGIIEED
jgi:hypothetical protein